jgi:hypothetical protein
MSNYISYTDLSVSEVDENKHTENSGSVSSEVINNFDIKLLSERLDDYPSSRIEKSDWVYMSYPDYSMVITDPNSNSYPMKLESDLTLKYGNQNIYITFNK